MADVSVDQSKLPGVKEGRPGLAGSGELGCAGRGPGSERRELAWSARGCGRRSPGRAALFCPVDAYCRNYSPARLARARGVAFRVKSLF